MCSAPETWRRATRPKYFYRVKSPSRGSPHSTCSHRQDGVLNSATRGEPEDGVGQASEGKGRVGIMVSDTTNMCFFPSSKSHTGKREKDSFLGFPFIFKSLIFKRFREEFFKAYALAISEYFRKITN